MKQISLFYTVHLSKKILFYVNMFVTLRNLHNKRNYYVIFLDFYKICT